MKKTWLPLLGLFALSLAAACEGGDDDDDIASPTPYNPDVCYIIWARPTGGLYDAYVWQAGAGVVTSSTVASYSFNTNEFDSVLGFFYYRTDNTFTTYARLAVTTNGAFTFSGAGVQTGDAWTFDDTTNQRYYEVPLSGPLLGQIASNGTGGFSGDLSEPEGTVSPGTGALTIAYLSSTITMNAQYAVCMDETSSAAFAGKNRPSAGVRESASRILRSLH